MHHYPQHSRAGGATEWNDFFTIAFTNDYLKGSRATPMQANYLILLLERVKGIEPSSSAWKAVALPLSYTREIKNLARSLDIAQAPERQGQLHPEPGKLYPAAG